MIRPNGGGEQGGTCLIAHYTKGVNPVIKAMDPFLEQVIKFSIVGRTEKNGLPSIATKIHMLKRARTVKAWFKSHLQKPARREVKLI